MSGRSLAVLVAVSVLAGCGSGASTKLITVNDDVGGPRVIDPPTTLSVTEPSGILRYRDLAVLVRSGHVYALMATGQARTRSGVEIGSSPATAGKAYRHPFCSVARSHSNRLMPYCSYPVRAGRVVFGRDPIRSITLKGYGAG
jgi:hypothetical protein